MKKKCAVFKADGNCSCIIELSAGIFHKYLIPISNDKAYDDLKEYQISLAYIEFFDGTLPIDIEITLENNPELENVFMRIQDVKFISIMNEGSEIKIMDVIKQGDLENILLELFKAELS